eukprot:3256467-Amphidinium_carterae.1
MHVIRVAVRHKVGQQVAAKRSDFEGLQDVDGQLLRTSLAKVPRALHNYIMFHASGGSLSVEQRLRHRGCHDLSCPF